MGMRNTVAGVLAGLALLTLTAGSCKIDTKSNPATSAPVAGLGSASPAVKCPSRTVTNGASPKSPHVTEVAVQSIMGPCYYLAPNPAGTVPGDTVTFHSTVEGQLDVRITMSGGEGGLSSWNLAKDSTVYVDISDQFDGAQVRRLSGPVGDVIACVCPSSSRVKTAGYMNVYLGTKGTTLSAEQGVYYVNPGENGAESRLFRLVRELIPELQKVAKQK
jgi:hypothetical protein